MSRVHFASIGIERIDPIYQAIHRDECKNLARKVTWCFYIFGLRNHHHQTILYPNLYYSLRCSLSANTGSIYCKPQCARPSKLTVVGCLCAHECLSSKTFLFNLQSNDGSRSPHHKVPWISGPQCSLTTSSLVSPLWTSRTRQVFFVHPSSHCLLNALTTFENILSSAYVDGFEEFGSTFGLIMMFRRVVFSLGLYPLFFSLSLFRRPFPFNLVLCHRW